MICDFPPAHPCVALPALAALCGLQCLRSRALEGVMIRLEADGEEMGSGARVQWRGPHRRRWSKTLMDSGTAAREAGGR